MAKGDAKTRLETVLRGLDGVELWMVTNPRFCRAMLRALEVVAGSSPVPGFNSRPPTNGSKIIRHISLPKKAGSVSV